MKLVTFKYPEVIHNYFMFQHAVDDYNRKPHSPISLEVVRATKRWANRVFTFLLSITEVNCFLAELHFMDQKSGSMMEFWKQLMYQLIENDYLEKEEAALRRRSIRIQEGIGHGCSLFHCSKNLLGQKSSILCPNTPPPPPCKYCKREVRTYCRCTPGVHLCSHCLAEHIHDADIEG